MAKQTRRFIPVTLFLILSGIPLQSLDIKTNLSMKKNTGYLDHFNGSGYLSLKQKFGDPFSALLKAKYSFNQVIYDGIGNNTLINVANFNGNFTLSLFKALSIMISPSYGFSMDYYNTGIMTDISLNFDKFMFGGYGSFNQEKFIFPPTGLGVTINNPAYGIYFTWFISDSLDLDISGDSSISLYENSTEYSAYTARAGLVYYINDFSLGGAISAGTDTADYTLLGADLSISYEIFKNFTLGISGDYSYSTATVTTASTTGNMSTTSKSGSQRKGNGSANAPSTKRNPFSVQESYYLFSIGGTVTYKFSL